MMSRWIVPLDDTNTMLIEYRHVSETEGVVTPDWWADRGIMLPGQLGADTYEASQRQPGDFEAQVSQRPVAVHGLEHLGTTDRGITMFRNQIRKGIRAVKAGSEPVGLFRDNGAPIPTYCNDTVVRVPPAKTAELDKKLLRDTGRRLAARLHRRAAADGGCRIATATTADARGARRAAQRSHRRRASPAGWHCAARRCVASGRSPCVRGSALVQGRPSRRSRAW